MPPAPTVVVVDDAVDLRALVRAKLRQSGRFEVVGEGGTGREAVELAASWRPDLLLLDVSMPDLDGLAALPQVLAASPGTQVVMLTGFNQRDVAEQARALGAAAVLEKASTVPELAEALLAILGAPADVLVDVAVADPLLGDLASADDQARFLADTVHKLRTPIGVLGGSADLLRQHWDELAADERVELLEAMTTNAAQLRQLVDELSTAARQRFGTPRR